MKYVSVNISELIKSSLCDDVALLGVKSLLWRYTRFSYSPNLILCNIHVYSIVVGVYLKTRYHLSDMEEK